MKAKRQTKKYPAKPVIGSKIYIDSSYHISRGSDDVTGGLATISKISKSMSGGKMEWFIEVKEVPNSGYNYAILIEPGNQERLKKEFGKLKAHPSCDIDTP